MTSTTYYNNQAAQNTYGNQSFSKPPHSSAKQIMNIFWWTIKTSVPVLIVFTIVLMLSAPLISSVLVIDDAMRAAKTIGSSDSDYLCEFITGMYGTIFVFVGLIFSVIASARNFGYMHNKRTVDTFYSLPVSRTSMLLGRYFATLAVIIVPIIFATSYMAIISATYDNCAMILFKYMLMYILGVTAIISLMAFLSVCCGTLVDAIISFFIINIVYPILVLVCQLFPANLVLGYTADAMNLEPTFICALSPLISPYFGIWSYKYSEGFTYHHAIHLGWFLLFIALCVLGSLLIVKSRKSETAQNNVVSGIPKYVIMVISSFLIGLCFGWGFANLGYDITALQYIWFWIGAFIGSSAIFLVLHIFYNKGFKGFLRSVIIYAAMMAVSLMMFTCVTSGWFGYESYIPDDNAIESAMLVTNRTRYDDTIPEFTDEESINCIRDIHAQIIEDNKDNDKYIVGTSDDYYDSTYYDITIEYTLKNGMKIKRGYNEADDLDGVQNQIENFVQSGTYALKTNPIFFRDIEDLSYVEIYPYQNKVVDYSSYLWLNPYNDTDKEIISEITEAVKTDINENVDVVYDNSDTYEVLYEISLEYDSLDSNNIFYGTPSSSSYCYITEEYTNTLEVFEKYGFNNGLIAEAYHSAYFCGDSADYDYAEFTGKYVYFEAPDDWENKQVYVNLCDEYDSPMATPQDFIAKCDRVKDNIWKFQIMEYKDPYDDEAKNVEFERLYFYEYNEENECYYTTELDYITEGYIYRCENVDGEYVFSKIEQYKEPKTK